MSDWTGTGAAASATAALCTRAQVKTRGGIVDTAKDTAIDALLPLVLTRFNADTGREFMPQVTEIRTFDADRLLIPLYGCDLRALTVSSTVVLNPELASELETLVEGADFRLEVDRLTSTAGVLRLASGTSLGSTYSGNFGHARIAITGPWGIWGSVSEVADDINSAAIECVLSWLDRSIQTVSGLGMGGAREVLPSNVGSWDIPASAWRKLQPYSRKWGVY
jgi:hypothetical protein